jgi:O-antigen ligase
MLLLQRRGRADRLELTKFEIAWALLSAVAVVSAVLKSQELNAAVRTAVDTFCLPLVAFHLARHHFRTESRGAALIAGAIALSIFLFAVGFLEFWTAADLFQYKGTELIRARERRVNGPFNSDASYAAISLLIAAFLIGAPRAFRLKLDASANLTRWAGIAAAVAASLLPLFRGIAVAIGACLLTAVLARSKAEKRRLRFSSGPKTAAAILVLFSLLILGGAAGLTDLSALPSRLQNPRNLVGRVVTWNVALGIAFANPLFGVGLNNYKPYFDANYNQDADWLARGLEVKPAPFPHSNYLWIGSELGLPALVTYLLAFGWLIAASWRGLRQRTDHARAAAICSLALTTAYLVHGLTLTSGWYSELNLYYFFMTGLLANIFSVEENARQD